MPLPPASFFPAGEVDDDDFLTISLPPPPSLLPAYRAGDSRSSHAHYSLPLLKSPDQHSSSPLSPAHSFLASPFLHSPPQRLVRATSSAVVPSSPSSSSLSIPFYKPLSLSARTSPCPLPTHHEEPPAEDKTYSPSSQTFQQQPSSSPFFFPSSSSASPSSSPSPSSPPSPSFSLPSTSSLAFPPPVRSHSALSSRIPLDALSAHVNPVVRAVSMAPHRSMGSAGRRGRTLGIDKGGRWEEKEEGDDGAQRGLSYTTSTASTCSQMSSSTPSSRWRGWGQREDAADDDAEEEADASDGDEGEGQEADEVSVSRPLRALHLRTSGSFSASASAPNIAGGCFSPTSPLFDSSLDGGRHSADPSLSAGIGVFAAQLATLQRLRSSNSPNPVQSRPIGERS